MMSCESFRTRFHVAAEDAALLEHLRNCDRCLDHAATIDPDVIFRSLGGAEMIPPGGIDAFVDDVMQQVRVRGAENRLSAPKRVDWTRRLAVAATVAAALSTSVLTSRSSRPAPELLTEIRRTEVRSFATKPVVETYESQNATIVEVPADGAGDDVKIVMIFDESLPADL